MVDGKKYSFIKIEIETFSAAMLGLFPQRSSTDKDEMCAKEGTVMLFKLTDRAIDMT